MLTRSTLPIALLMMFAPACGGPASAQQAEAPRQVQEVDDMMWLDAVFWAGMRQQDAEGDDMGGGGGARWGGGAQSGEGAANSPDGAGEHGSRRHSGQGRPETPAPSAEGGSGGESGGKRWQRKADSEQGAGSGGAGGGGSGRPKFKRPEGMGQMYALRAGSFPDRSGSPEYLKNAALWLSTPEGVTNRVEMQPMGRRGQVLSVSGKVWGHYNVLAYADAGVRSGVRQHFVSLATFMSHGDKVTPKAAPDPEGPGLHNGKPVLNIEQHFHHHSEMHRTYTGNTLHIRVSFQDKPLANKEVLLVTEKNWRQSKRTNDAGEADFLLIKEDFSRASSQAKPDKYMFVVEHTEAASGEVNGQPYTSERYVATRPLLVFPSRLEWESRSTAYLVVMATAIVSGGAIAIRRRRRRRKAK